MSSNKQIIGIILCRSFGLCLIFVAIVLLFLICSKSSGQSISKQKADIITALGGKLAQPQQPIIIRPLRHRVGYMPIITVLPQGAQLRCGIVVSHDRRYVGFNTSGLMFSQINGVHTFQYRR